MENLLDLQNLQIIAQLVENIRGVVDDLEKAYSNKDSFSFEKAKKDILNSQTKIQDILK